jgi:mycothiol system anti-sigma-R factor
VSCGNHHDLDCGSILAALDAFIDGEESDLDRVKIAQHLHECGPCLQEQHVEQLVKAIVARGGGGERCSEQIRARIVTRIREVRVEMTVLRTSD